MVGLEVGDVSLETKTNLFFRFKDDFQKRGNIGVFEAFFFDFSTTLVLNASKEEFSDGKIRAEIEG